jgi:ATP-grasp enzyme of GAK system
MIDIIPENFQFLVAEVDNQIRGTRKLISEFDFELIDKLEARDDYIDNLLPGRDLGIAFINGRYLTTYARCADQNAWNTTTRSGGKYVAYDPDPAVIELARRAQAPFNLDFTCVDVAESADGPIVFEVSAFGGFKGIETARGIDAAARYADFVIASVSSS